MATDLALLVPWMHAMRYIPPHPSILYLTVIKASSTANTTKIPAKSMRSLAPVTRGDMAFAVDPPVDVAFSGEGNSKLGISTSDSIVSEKHFSTSLSLPAGT